MKKILVIDDDATSIRLLQSRLEVEGFRIIIARDGDVGLEKVQKEQPELIILDVEMPRMNGYFFITELRKMKGYEHLPIVVLTSHPDKIDVFTAKGIAHYMTKPINFDVLIETIKSILP